MSQKTRASGSFGSPHGTISNVSGSGIARTSASWTREKPSIDDPELDDSADVVDLLDVSVAYPNARGNGPVLRDIERRLGYRRLVD